MMPTEELLERDTTPPKTDDTSERKQSIQEAMKGSRLAPLVEARQEYEGQREEWKADKLAQLRSHPDFRRGFEETYDMRSLEQSSEEVGRRARGVRQSLVRDRLAEEDPLIKRHDSWVRIPGVTQDPYTGEHHTIYNDPYALGKAEGAEAARRRLIGIGDEMGPEVAERGSPGHWQGILDEAKRMAGTEEQRVRERWKAKSLANTGGWEPSEEEREEYERRWAMQRIMDKNEGLLPEDESTDLDKE